MHNSSFLNMEQFINTYLDPSMEYKIADIGSQDVNEVDEDHSYKPLFFSPKWTYFGCDIFAGKNVDIVLDSIYNWKSIKSNSFDVVISGQAFEHIEYFWVTMAEIERILKEGGYCCIIAPSSGYRHRYPVDCWRFYEDGLAALAKYVDLEVIDVSTQRDRYDFPQYDKTWQDSILICRKPMRSIKSKLKIAIKNKLNKYLVNNFNHISLSNTPQVVTQLYWSVNGREFTEELSKRRESIVLNGSFTVYYDMTDCNDKNNIISIRFDPSTSPVGIEIVQAKAILTDKSQYDLHLINSNQTSIADNILWFNHNDSNLLYDVKGIPLSLLDTIKFQCKYHESDTSQADKVSSAE